MKKKPKVLAIDFGTQRIGLALSYGSLAEPLEVIKNDQAAIDYIKDLCYLHQVERILIGLSENKTAELTRQFGKKLKAATLIPVGLYDETLSTQKARQKLRESPAKKSKRRQPVDHLAAQEFLQDFLDSI